MVNFTVDQLKASMEKKNNIRNISVIAHVDHGKTTLTDSLIMAAGIISEHVAGDARYMSARSDEQKRGITIKSTGVSLHYELSDDKVPQGSDGNDFLVNLIDSPGHVDFSSEVTAALRVTDGALVVVDAVEGICVQTETVLRQALAERIKPVLMVNKVDRVLMELMLDPETAYQSFSRTIESANVIISTYEDELLGDVQVHPSRGTVAFGSGLHGWGFTLTRFADMYAKKFGVDRELMMTKLWGENFFDPTTKTWKETAVGENGSPLKRAFVQYVLDPIYRLFDATLCNEKEKVDKMLKALEITLKGEEKELTEKPLLKAIMRKFLPCSDALLEMIVSHLPSPVKAQRYRVGNLYEGPLDDDCARAIRECDPHGPLMVYISKMVPGCDRGRFYAFGRVFSGTISSGQRVKIMGANYEPGKSTDVAHKNIQRVVLMMGRTYTTVGEVSCGNTVALVGVDDVLIKSGTITDNEKAFPLKAMKFSVSPVVRVAVDPQTASERPKLVEGLKSLSKSDPLVNSYYDDATGQYIIEGAGELHLEIALKDLAEFAGIELKISEPVVSFRESVSASSAEIQLAKTANKHNRLYFSAAPIDMLTEAIESKAIRLTDDEKKRVRILVEDFAWDVNEAKKLWAFGPNDDGPNVFVDVSRSVMGLNEIKDSILSGFDSSLSEGVLCGEPVRGIRINLHDAMIHSDPPHRSASQITPAAKRAVYAAMLAANPVLLEPIYLIEVACPQDAVGGVYSVVNRRRGQVISEEQRIGAPLFTIKAYLPVLESFGFTAALRAETSGRAFPQAVFDHWQPLPGDPLQPGTKAHQVMTQVRKRKGMKETLPSIDQYADKL